jgi:hypothetical protein
MALGLSAAAANTFLAAHAAAFPWIKLHIGDPGAAGTANAAVETDRIQVSFATPAGGVIANDAEERWDAVAASEDPTHWSGWSAQTNGTFGWSGTVTANPVTAGDNLVVAIGGLTYTLNVAG